MNSLKKMHEDPKLTHHHTETTFNIQLLPGFKNKTKKQYWQDNWKKHDQTWFSWSTNMRMCEEEDSCCNECPGAEISTLIWEETDGCHLHSEWDTRCASMQTAANTLQEHYGEFLSTTIVKARQDLATKAVEENFSHMVLHGKPHKTEDIGPPISSTTSSCLLLSKGFTRTPAAFFPVCFYSK